jgi:hypothetical protein
MYWLGRRLLEFSFELSGNQAVIIATQKYPTKNTDNFCGFFYHPNGNSNKHINIAPLPLTIRYETYAQTSYSFEVLTFD